MDFVALDFETANYQRGSVCEVGIAVVRSGEVVETVSRLVRPRHNWFHPMNIHIHGIDARRVEKEPEFDTVWQDIRAYFENSCVVAHNASFDVSVLRHALTQYALPFPVFRYTCSLLAARCAWQGLPSYGLSALSEKFDIQLDHHRAASDALACARILLEAARTHGVATLEELCEVLAMRMGKVFPGGYEPAGKRKTPRKARTL